MASSETTSTGRQWSIPGARFMLSGLAVGHATFHWIMQSFAVALPEIQVAFGLNSLGAAGILSARELAAGLIALPGGVVVDIVRRYWGLLLAVCLAIAALWFAGDGNFAGIRPVAGRDRRGGHFPLGVASAGVGVALTPLCGTQGHGSGCSRGRRERWGRRGAVGNGGAAGHPAVAGVAQHICRRAILPGVHGGVVFPQHRTGEHRIGCPLRTRRR